MENITVTLAGVSPDEKELTFDYAVGNQKLRIVMPKKYLDQVIDRCRNSTQAELHKMTEEAHRFLTALSKIESLDAEAEKVVQNSCIFLAGLEVYLRTEPIRRIK